MTRIGPTVAGLDAIAIAISRQTVLQSDVPGSFLVFPLFDIRSGNATHIRITDVSGGLNKGTTSVKIHINYVCGGVPDFSGGAPTYCATTDNSDKFLTDHGTLDIDVANDSPPCDQGFITVFATSNKAVNCGNTGSGTGSGGIGSTTGCPIAYDSLVGSYHIYYAANANGNPNSAAVAASETGNAIAVQSAQTALTALGALDPNAVNYDLTFGTLTTADYVALPRVLHGTYRALNTTTSTSYLILLTPNITTGTDNTVTTVGVSNYAMDESAKSAGDLNFWCWEKVPLNSINPAFNANALGSPIGYFKLSNKNVPKKPILGAVPHFAQCRACAVFDPVLQYGFPISLQKIFTADCSALSHKKL